MKRGKRRMAFVALAAVAALTLVLAACAGDEDTPTPAGPATPLPAATPVPAATATPAPVATLAPPPTPKPVAEIQRGGIVSYANHSTFPSFDLHWEGSHIATQPLSPIYNSLLTMDIFKSPGEAITPDLAKSWKISGDGLTVTFDLRDDVKFHSGHPFTCEDVAASLDKMTNPDMGSKADELPTYESTECPDDHTAVVHLSSPQASFITAMANVRFEIQQKEIVEQVTAFRQGITKRPEFLEGGTGPFIYKSWTPGVDFVGQANPNYWKMGVDGKPLPYIDGYKSVVMPDLSAIFAALRAHQITMSGIGRQLEKTMADVIEDDYPEIVVATAPRNAWHNIIFNNEKPPVNDLKVRQAFWLAIDQRATIQAAVEGWGSLGGFISPYHDYALPQDELLAMDIFSEDMEARRAQAKQILADAGYPDGLDMTLWLRRGPLYAKGAIANQADLKRVGINLNIRKVDTATIGDISRKGEFEIYTSPSSTSFDDPDAYYTRYTCASLETLANTSRYCNPEFDDLFERQMRESDHAKRVELTREMERILLRDLPAHRSYYWWQTMGYWNNLQGWQMNFGDNVYNFGRWETVWCIDAQCNK